MLGLANLLRLFVTRQAVDVDEYDAVHRTNSGTRCEGGDRR